MHAKVDMMGLKTAYADAVAKYGVGTRADAIKSVMSDAMDIRAELMADADYVAQKKVVDSQKKSIDAVQSIIKDGLKALDVDEYEHDGTTVAYRSAKLVLLSRIAEADPQGLLEFIRSGAMDGSAIKTDAITNPHFAEVVKANTVPIKGAVYFKD